MARYFQDIGSQAYPGGVTYGSKWLSRGQNGRPIPESFHMSHLQTPSQYSSSPASSRRTIPDADYYPRDPYNDPYMQTYHDGGFQQQPIIQQQQQGQQSNNGTPAKGFNNVISDFSRNYSSAHGLPNIYNATTVVGRIIWILIFAGALSVCGWQFFRLITKFLESSVATELSIVSDSSLAFPAVTVCNTNKLRRSGIIFSKHREVLFIDDQQPLPYYAPCIEGDFACNNGELCIKTYLLCDGINHCGDGSDERECEYGDCGSEQFRCKYGGPDGYCIDTGLVCDRIRDCYFGYDEFDCECKTSEWKCTNEGGCIPRANRCDGIKDCLDNSDEENCPKAEDCSDGFLCTYSEQCIHKSFVCDEYNDCNDGSDETEASCMLASEADYDAISGVTPPCIQGSGFNCGNGTCYPATYVCDGDSDCYNGADEETELCGVTAARCNENQFSCNNGRQCIPKNGFCNIRPQCTDFSDEMEPCQCNVTDRTNVLQSIRCPNGKQSILSIDGIMATGNVVMCANGGGGHSRSAAAQYECDGSVYCFDPETGYMETCLYLFTECYIREDGSDYHGKVYQTVGNTFCLEWTATLPESLGYTKTKYVYLDKHPFCRNPGGEKDRPWCFIQGATGPNDWMYCDVPEKQDTCVDAEEPLLRLADGGSSSEGRVEILSNGEYASVNDRVWTMEDGNAVCRHLGFQSSTAVYSDASHFGSGSGPVYFSLVACSGEEENLFDCGLVAADLAQGDHSKDVGVSCTGSQATGNRRKRAASQELGDTRVTYINKQEQTHVRGNDNMSTVLRSETEEMLRSQYKHDLTIPTEFDEFFTCTVSNETVPWYQTCNYYPDCEDGSDESICGLRDRLCPLRSRPCRYEPFCIQSNFECDGNSDCRNGLDEEFCDDIECPKNYWKCTSSPLCIPIYAVCDTISDCKEEEDESNCTNRASEVSDPFANMDWINKYTDKEVINTAEAAIYAPGFAEFYKRRSFDRVKGESPPDWKRFFTFSQQADYSDLTDVLKVSRLDIQNFGHQLQDIILECYFDEQECDIESDFVPSQTDEYGNCYTYNYHPSGTPVTSNRSGPKHGLSLVLNLEQHEYLSLYGQRAGARVTITQPSVRPLPEEDGFMIRPGVETSIGMRLNEISRMSSDDVSYGDFGTCEKNNEAREVIEDGERVTTTDGGYDRRVCLQNCRDLVILEICECSSTIELDGPRCKVTNTEQDICVEFITYLHQRNTLNCHCDYPCTDRFTTKTISQSVWPSDVYLPHLLRSMHADNNKTKDINDIDSVRRNIARLNVFYEELNYEKTTEVPAYEPESLFSDIGGTLGLYIGFSVITALEFLVLIYELCVNCGRNPEPRYVS